MTFNTTFIAKSLIIHSESAPGDTRILWFDTVEGALKFYNKSSASWEKVVNITDLYSLNVRGTLTLRGTRTEIIGFDDSGHHWVRGVAGSDNDLFVGFRKRGAGDIAIYSGAPILPRVDNRHSLGSSSLKWANVYADNVYTGDLNFEEKECVACGRPFMEGDELVLKVKKVDDYTRTVPVHLKCSQAYKEPQSI